MLHCYRIELKMETLAISYLFFSKKLSGRVNLGGCWDLELFLEVTHDQLLEFIFVCGL